MSTNRALLVLIDEEAVDSPETPADVLQYAGYPALTAANGSEGVALLPVVRQYCG